MTVFQWHFIHAEGIGCQLRKIAKGRGYAVTTVHPTRRFYRYAVGDVHYGKEWVQIGEDEEGHRRKAAVLGKRLAENVSNRLQRELS